MQSQGGQRGGGLRADAGHERRRAAGEALARLLAREHDEARRLLGVRGHLRDQLVGPDPHRARQLRRALDLDDQPAHGSARAVQAVEREVRLVEPDYLHALHVRAHHVHHRAGDLAVGGEVGGQEDGLRAQPSRLRGGHRRPHAIGARLVGGRGHDRARAAAGDDDRPAAQLGVPAQLDGDVERICVQMRHAQF